MSQPTICSMLSQAPTQGDIAKVLQREFIPLTLADAVTRAFTLLEFFTSARLNRGVWMTGPIPNACISMVAKQKALSPSNEEVAAYLLPQLRPVKKEEKPIEPVPIDPLTCKN